jgi:hypothetical protein
MGVAIAAGKKLLTTKDTKEHKGKCYPRCTRINADQNLEPQRAQRNTEEHRGKKIQSIGATSLRKLSKIDGHSPEFFPSQNIFAGHFDPSS